MPNPYDILKESERSPIPKDQIPYLVECLRAKVAEWRDGGYKGLSDTTYRLFAHWFGEEHISQRQDGTFTKFQYYFCQQEAIVYLYEVEKMYYDERAKRVYINAGQYFEGVPKDVWEFHIGGYQVCAKWLKDRKGRDLSDDDIVHYQKIAVALKETIRLMGEIEKWPME